MILAPLCAAPIPAEPDEIGVLRSRLAADAGDVAALILFIWRRFQHMTAVHDEHVAMVARVDELCAESGSGGHEELCELMDKVDMVARWFKEAMAEFTDATDRVEAIREAATPDALQSLRDAMNPTDFGRMYDELDLAVMLDRASPKMPDRSRLNDLRLAAFGGDADAGTIMLTLDAMAEHNAAIVAHVVGMNDGTLVENPAYRREALEWFGVEGAEVEELGRLFDGFDPYTKTRAVAKLRGEMAPDDFDRLYRNCGIAPL